MYIELERVRKSYDWILRIAFAVAASSIVLPASSVAQTQRQTASSQQVFATPEAAVDALLRAFKADDDGVLLNLFGHQHTKLVVVTDKIARRESFEKLLRAAEESRRLEEAGKNTRTLVLGRRQWPFPIPLVKESKGWRFDTDAGAEEIINRRIGANELEAIAVCRAYVDAQEEYAARDRDGDQVLEYAQRLGSTTGKRDGLYWEVDPASGDPMSPFGPLMADAHDYLKGRQSGAPFEGYYYRILTRQGAYPPGGSYDYVINGNMIAGFALIAYPADYSSSGVMTVMVSHHGKVYERDLGDDTRQIAKNINEYNADDTWHAVED